MRQHSASASSFRNENYPINIIDFEILTMFSLISAIVLFLLFVGEKTKKAMHQTMAGAPTAIYVGMQQNNRKKSEILPICRNAYLLFILPLAAIAKVKKNLSIYCNLPIKMFTIFSSLIFS